MPHPLQQQVQVIARRARRLMLAHGVGCVVALCVAAGFLLGLGDYFIRYQELGVRVICSAALLLVLVGSCCYFLLPALRFRRDSIEVAQRIELRFPELQGRLSTSLAFLHQDEHDPVAGSAELRRAVIAETSAVLQRVPTSEVLNGKIPFRVVLIAVVVCEFVAGVCLLDVKGASVAAERLAAPWTATTWPKRNDLRFVAPPTKVAAETDVPFTLIDNNGRLPDSVMFQFRFEGDDHVREKRMTLLDKRMTAQLSNVARSFQFRAVGGDDETVWRSVQVRKPATITQLEVRLFPPQYTGLPTETTSGHIRAMHGTRIEITGVCDRPLKSARLTFKHAGGAQQVPVRLSEDGMSFSAPADPGQPWLVSQSGSYWLELVDLHDVQSGKNRRWEIRAIADRPPAISLQEPAANLFVTPMAVVPVEATVSDDMAIREIHARFTHYHKVQNEYQQKQEQSIELFARDAASESSAGIEKRADEDRQLVRHELDVSQIGGLAPGDYVDLQLIASDFKPQNGESPMRRLTIISPQELEERIGQRQTYILGQLAEVLAVQRESQSQTKALQTQLAQVGRLERRDIDQLQSAELTQRQVRRLLIEDENSAANQIAQLLRDLHANRVDSPDVVRRMNDLLAEIRRLDTEHLTAVQRELINTLKIAREESQNGGSVGDSVRDPLDVAGDHQVQVIAALENILGELSEWDNYRRFARDISRLRRQQQEAGKQLDDLPPSMLSRDINELSNQEKADLQKLAARQMELARQFDKIGARMRQMQSQLQGPEPLIAETIADALDAAARHALSGQMRESGRNIDSNQIGRAAEAQDDIMEGLNEILDILANRREHELDRIVEQLREAADELAELREQEEMLRESVDAAAAEPDAAKRQQQLENLSKQQQQLAERVRRLQRRLQRLQAERSAVAAEQAIQRLQRSAAAAQQDEAKRAAEQAEQATKLLEEAQRQLQQDLRQAEQELFQEQIARLQQKIQGLVRRQQNFIAQTAEIDGLRDDEGKLSREQNKSLLRLSRAQLGLAEETNMLADTLAQSEAFQLGLGGAAREMFRAAGRLGRLDTSIDTIRTQRAALVRLQQLVEALKPPGDDGAAEQGDAGQPGEVLASDVIRLLAELRLVKMLQEEVHQRTAELQRARIAGGGKLTGEQEQELADLVKEQGRLADLVTKLSQPPANNPEDDPDSLPDVRKDDKVIK